MVIGLVLKVRPSNTKRTRALPGGSVSVVSAPFCRLTLSLPSHSSKSFAGVVVHAATIIRLRHDKVNFFIKIKFYFVNT